jgi:hypothetical protein
MRMEGRGNNAHSPAPTLRHGSPQDLLMAEVHPVEVPEGHDYPAQSTTSALPSSPSSLYTANNSSPHITL